LHQVAEKTSVLISPKVIAFPRCMSAQAPLPTEQPQQPLSPPAQSTWWQRHGTTASWIALGVSALTVIGLFINIYLTLSANNARMVDEHTNTLIDAKLNPATEKVNDHVDRKVDELSKKIDALSDRVSRIEGSLGKRVAAVETKTNQQISLARVMDPAHTLTTIRAELNVARASGKLLSVSDLDDYRNAVQALPGSAREYWTTAAAIINYQSLVNQANGAPDPFKVSRLCLGLTSQGSVVVSNSLHVGGTYSNCVVDLDTNGFKDVVFKDSVIRYRGGKTVLVNVDFQNCTFVLDLPPEAPAHPEVIRTLLASDQRQVTLSTHS